MQIQVIEKKKKYIIYINNKIFFVQQFIKSKNKNLSPRFYTWFYLLKIMYRFGLIGPISKNAGY